MKKYLIPVGIVLGLSGVALAVPAERVQPEKIEICHRTNSVTNPYNKIEVSVNAVDGEGQNDHTHHTGPVATSEAVAQELKDNKEKWGDIIPNGLNWEEGQAMYENDCNYVVTVPPTPPPPVAPNPPVVTPNPTSSANPPKLVTPTTLPAVGADGK